MYQSYKTNWCLELSKDISFNLLYWTLLTFEIVSFPFPFFKPNNLESLLDYTIFF